ncbi:hypothetical protein Droror1_Dr00009659 [Drosera rotundifolia]
MAYFLQFHHTQPADKLILAGMHLDEPAIIWYQSVARDGMIPNWEAFEATVMQRFGPSEYEDPSLLLEQLTQTGTVQEYQTKFEHLAARVNNLSSEHRRGFFIAGLNLRIQQAVIAQQPRDFHDACSLARLFEVQFRDVRPTRSSPVRLSTAPNSVSPSSTANTFSTLPIKQLTRSGKT